MASSRKDTEPQVKRYVKYQKRQDKFISGHVKKHQTVNKGKKIKFSEWEKEWSVMEQSF